MVEWDIVRMYVFGVIWDKIFSSLRFKTALHKAVYQGYVECVRALLNAGADVTAKNVSWIESDNFIWDKKL